MRGYGYRFRDQVEEPVITVEESGLQDSDNTTEASQVEPDIMQQPAGEQEQPGLDDTPTAFDREPFRSKETGRITSDPARSLSHLSLPFTGRYRLDFPGHRYSFLCNPGEPPC